MRDASRSRWKLPSPRNSSLDFARLKYRWASCSQVKPMPPWIWIFSAATWKYVSAAYAFTSEASAGISGEFSATAAAA
jgi:hypothetical protein